MKLAISLRSGRHPSTEDRGRVSPRPANFFLRSVPIGASLALAFCVATATSTTFAADSSDNKGSSELHRGAQEAGNKLLIQNAYKALFTQGDASQVNKYFAPDFIQHDPDVAAGRQGVIDMIKAQQALTPKPVTTIKHLLADGSLVLVHAQVSTLPTNEFSGTARADVYRVLHDTIVEHWSIAQAVPSFSVNSNSMFSDLYKYPGTPPTLTELQEDTNKHLVQNAFAALMTAHSFGVLDKYWTGADYIQHNPRIPNGTAAVRGFFSSVPPVIHDVRFLLADGDLVFTFSQSLAPDGELNNENIGTAVGDLARVANGKIVEHWDVISPVPATTANGNSVFSELYPIGR